MLFKFLLSIFIVSASLAGGDLSQWRGPQRDGKYPDKICFSNGLLPVQPFYGRPGIWAKAFPQRRLVQRASLLRG